jgi:hypothetical protein
MLILDDILCFPASSILWIFREIYGAALQEQAMEAETITAELMDLHMMLDTGKITSDLFDAREKELLDRLDQLEEHGIRGRSAD